MSDVRPENYQYYDNLVRYIGGEDKLFKPAIPRQIELHLPGDNKRRCPMNCGHCQGGRFSHDLSRWSQTALVLLHNLKGRIPYHIYGGAYTEPVISPYLCAFLGETKYYGNHFGIHTSGDPLWSLEENQGLLTEIVALASDTEDYVSFSLDAGSAHSHMRGKGLRTNKFDGILSAIRFLSTHSERKLSVRLCYLLNQWNSSEEEIVSIVNFAKDVGVDSLRFSIPYAQYLQTFDKVEKYKARRETPMIEKYRKIIDPSLSSTKQERPYIFYVTPEEGFTDIALYSFKQCVYGHYQITYGADGYVYKCSAIAAPDMKHLRLGRITSDVDEFMQMNAANLDPEFNAQASCFAYGGRCNRMAVECNSRARDFFEGKQEETA